jgi:hypothetical protein
MHHWHSNQGQLVEGSDLASTTIFQATKQWSVVTSGVLKSISLSKETLPEPIKFLDYTFVGALLSDK